MHRYRREIAVCFGLGLLMLAAYAGALTAGFINFDDPLYVSQNPNVERGLTVAGIKYAWTTFDCGNYHPLTWLSLELDATLYGLKPAGFHATNVALHLANSVLLFIVLLRMTGGLWPSAIVAAFFALHPMHVESVAWISERKDVLSTFFLLLALVAYERYAASLSIARYTLVFIFMALGLLAKPMLVSLPFLLLLIDFWPLKRGTWVHNNEKPPDAPLAGALANREAVETGSSASRYPQRSWTALVGEKAPLFALAVASIAVTLIAQRAAGAYTSLTELPIIMRARNASYAYAWYVGKTFWPTDLTILYPHPMEKLSATMAGAGLLVLVAGSVFVFWPKRGHDPMAVGWLWFLGSLVPVIGFVQVGFQAYADRYVYVPHIGLFAMVVFGTCEMIAQNRSARSVWFVAAGVCIAVCLGLTHRQVAYWHSTEDLWQHALACDADNWMAHLSIGDLRCLEGNFEDGLAHYEAVARQPRKRIDVLFKIGTTLEALGRYREAEQQYAAVLQHNPQHDGARNSLVALYKKQGKLKLDPHDPASQNQYGLMLARLGETEEAARHFLAAVEQNPNFADAHCNLGLALSILLRDAEAKEHLLRALELAPAFAAAHFNLAALLQREGDLAGAREHFSEVLRLNPKDEDARQRLKQLQRR